ncbi:hypothetical protein [Glutamicibacter sp. TV12E]|uniref:hypothetical protein n=1 Tax=Glutamicibacter sp. TV12E TaxID=3446362 RepID=UPI004033949D
MKTFKLQKGDHIVTTVSPTEAVTFRARGFVDVPPEPKQAPKPKNTAKAETAEATETKN